MTPADLIETSQRLTRGAVSHRLPIGCDMNFAAKYPNNNRSPRLYGVPNTDKEFAMHRTLVSGFATAAFISGGLIVAGLGLVAGTAQADPMCSPTNANTAPCAPPEGPPGTCDANGVCGQLWCPGSGMGGIPNWDMNVCHTFYFDPNAPLTKPIIIQGQPPGPPAPPPPPCIPLINCLPGLTHG